MFTGNDYAGSTLTFYLVQFVIYDSFFNYGSRRAPGLSSERSERGELAQPTNKEREARRVEERSDGTTGGRRSRPEGVE